MTGYQMAILLLVGCRTGEKYRVQSIDRWYADAVSDLFPGCTPFQQHQAGKDSTWRITSRLVDYSSLSLQDVTDWQGFCRGVIELQGGVDLWQHRTRSGGITRTLRLRIFGQQDLLQAVMAHLPARPKKLQHVQTRTGSTCMACYQSPREVADILTSIQGEPSNKALWAKWEALLRHRE